MTTEFNYQIDGDIKTVTVRRSGDHFQVTIGSKTYRITARQPGQGELELEVGGRRMCACVARKEQYRYVALNGNTWVLERPQRQRRRAAGGDATGGLEASMPGVVLDVPVAEGDEVSGGDTLVLLEAMKMELRIKAPHDGRVKRIHCAAGQVVERGQILVEIEA